VKIKNPILRADHPDLPVIFETDCFGTKNPNFFINMYISQIEHQRWLGKSPAVVHQPSSYYKSINTFGFLKKRRGEDKCWVVKPPIFSIQVRIYAILNLLLNVCYYFKSKNEDIFYFLQFMTNKFVFFLENPPSCVSFILLVRDSMNQLFPEDRHGL
jgi:hypothetical protein